ncbi:SIS domain-containing protein [Tomitella gaofuii]|uniref:SIS domain-containing protein n=1 Tax=Tomitella gaofuii TaxID=2760083 RepID=UPI001C7117C5|nr:SIS domain-containing protein [Tomitella gaofuii]
MTSDSATEGGAPATAMAAEIAEQPERLAALLQRADGGMFTAAADAVDVERRPFAMIAARGTSDHAAVYLKHLLEVKTGIAVALASPSVFTVHRRSLRLDGALWIAISQSGGSPDLVEATRSARASGALTVAVTNAAGSDLASVAHLALDVGAGPEHAVPATKSYTSELLACWLLVEAMAGRDGAGAADLPEMASAAVAEPVPADLVAGLRDAGRLLLVGRGYSYPTALEGALKLVETAHLAAQGYSGADLLHGPIGVVNAGDPALVIMPDGPGGASLVPVLTRLRDAKADLTVLGPRRPDGFGGRLVRTRAGVPEDLSAIAQIIPLQKLACELAQARGLDPDAPRGLAKITRTR